METNSRKLKILTSLMIILISQVIAFLADYIFDFNCYKILAITSLIFIVVFIMFPKKH